MMAGCRDYFDFLSRLDNDPQYCFRYLLDGLDKKHPTYARCLNTISKDPKIALDTASKIIKGRFEIAEEAISKSSVHSYFYARDILKGRFALGESAIATDAKVSYDYARHVVMGRFELGEIAMAEDEDIAYHYATDIIKGELPEVMHNAMLAKRIAA